MSATGLVVLPYLEYPQLLPSMLELLGKGMAASVPWSLRREIMRTIGEQSVTIINPGWNNSVET